MLGILNQWKAGVPQSQLNFLAKSWNLLLLHPCAGNRSGRKFQGFGFNHTWDAVGIIQGFICRGIFWLPFSRHFFGGEVRDAWDTFLSDGSCLDPRSFQPQNPGNEHHPPAPLLPCVPTAPPDPARKQSPFSVFCG